MTISVNLTTLFPTAFRYSVKDENNLVILTTEDKQEAINEFNKNKKAINLIDENDNVIMSRFDEWAEAGKKRFGL